MKMCFNSIIGLFAVRLCNVTVNMGGFCMIIGDSMDFVSQYDPEVGAMIRKE